MTRRAPFERRLRDELHAARPPRAAEAERRAWHVVSAAHTARMPTRERRRGVRFAVAAATAAALGLLALTPAGAKVGDWIDDVVSPAPEATRSSLTSLPAKGRLLVVADGGAFIVHDDGARRRLGTFRDATWSPGGLFVAGARGRELVAMNPDGSERWTRPADGPVSLPRWSPDGYRIAYRSGSDLYVAIGNNDASWPLARGVGAAPPAWKPLPQPLEQVLAFAAGERVRIVEADTAAPPSRRNPAGAGAARDLVGRRRSPAGDGRGALGERARAGRRPAADDRICRAASRAPAPRWRPRASGSPSSPARRMRRSRAGCC